jgi:hypothetical protein
VQSIFATEYNQEEKQVLTHVSINSKDNMLTLNNKTNLINDTIIIDNQ